jgi:3-(3-hydroxy-phenyl)propionate hydroxylase
MPPFLGQGMCAGIRDAANLIWKLLLVEKAGVSPALLRSYQEERKVHVKNVVAQAKDLGLIIGELDLEAAKTRDARLRAERARSGGDPLRHRLIPPLAGGLIDCDERGQPRGAAGSLFPQPTVKTSDGRTALLDDVLPPVFLVVSRTIDAQSGLSERDLSMLRRIGALRVVLRSRGDPRFRARWRRDPGRAGRALRAVARRNRNRGGGRQARSIRLRRGPNQPGSRASR